MSVSSVLQYHPRLVVLTFSKDGTTTSGTYLRIGSVITSNTGFYLPYDGTIIGISATSQSTANSSVITLMDKTAVGTRVAISGAAITIPTGQFRVYGDYAIPIGAGTELCCYLSSGATRSNLVVNVFVEY